MSIRTVKKELAREQFNRQITKERTIGVDPIYHNRKWSKYDNVYQESKNWKKISKEYDENRT